MAIKKRVSSPDKKKGLRTGKRYTEMEKIEVLREISNGMKINEAIKNYGLTGATIYKWARERNVDVTYKSVFTKRVFSLQHKKLLFAAVKQKQLTIEELTRFYQVDKEDIKDWLNEAKSNSTSSGETPGFINIKDYLGMDIFKALEVLRFRIKVLEVIVNLVKKEIGV